MLRFISIGKQIQDEENQFAFYDTVTDRFIEFEGVQVFDSWDDFLLYYQENCYPQHDLSRFTNVTPDEIVKNG